MSRNGTVRTNPTKLTSPKVHPAPPPPKQQSGQQNNLSDAARGPIWPATIPTRVKKLSWGDDSPNKVMQFGSYTI